MILISVPPILVRLMTVQNQRQGLQCVLYWGKR